MSEIPAEFKHWEFDPTGTSPDNLIVGESHIISALDPMNQLVSPFYGPFYSVKLYDHNRELISKDMYTLGDRIPELIGVVQRPLYHNIIFKEPYQGEVFIDYQIAGAEFTRMRHQLLSWLVSKLNDPVKTSWEAVTEQPHMLPVFAHRHHWIDIMNTNNVGSVIDEITAAINTAFGTNSNNIYQSLVTRINNLSSLLVNYNIPNHVREGGSAVNNQHQTTAADIGAESTGSVARNSDALYGATYLALMMYVHAESVNWEKLEDYLHVYNTHTLTGDINTTNGIKWGNDNVSDLNVMGYFRMGGSGGVEFGPDTAILSVDDRGVLFNGEEFYDWRKAIEYSKELEGELLVSIESTDFTIAGNTTETSPIRLTLKYPLASNVEPGFLRLATSPSNNSDGWGFVSYNAKVMRDSLNNYLAKTITINGHPISSDVVLSKSEIGLSDVDNTSDTAKPVSTAQTTELNKLADLGHKHAWSDVLWLTATSTVLGIDKLSSNYNTPGAVSAKLGLEFSISVDDVIASFNGKVMVSEFEISAVHSVILSCNEFQVNVESGKVLRSRDGTVIEEDLPSGFADIPFVSRETNKDTLVYIVDNGGGNYTYKATPFPVNDYRSHVLVAVVNPSIPQTSAPQGPIADYGYDQGLEEHITDNKPHGLDQPISELSVVSNHDIFTELSLNAALMWKDNKLFYTNVNEFDQVSCSGLAIRSIGATPLSWRGDNGNGEMVYQASFVARTGFDNAPLDINTIEHDVILGAIQSDTFNFLTIKFSPSYLPRLYIERWGYSINGSEHVLESSTRTSIGLDYATQEGYLNADARSNHYRFYYDSGTDEFRWEVVGKKHIVQTGRVVGLTKEVKAELLELLANPYTGVRTSTNTTVAVTGAVRKPHPNTPNEVNNYSTLFNSYVSAAVLDRIRHDNKELRVEEVLTAYYSAADDSLVVDGVDSTFPHGFNNFDVQLMSCKPDSGVFDRDLDENVLTELLSMGVMTNVQNWENGFSGRVRRGEIYKIPLTAPKEYNGTVVSAPIEDGATFKIRLRIRAFNTIWGVSSSDWSYLSRHLVTQFTPPTQPDITPQYVLDGLDSTELT